MSMRKNVCLLVIGLLILSNSSAGQKKGFAPSWPNQKYSYVKLYLYNLDNQLEGQYQALKNGKLNFTLINPGVTLTDYQAKHLLAYLNSDTRILNEGLSKCYEPHHAFVFYDENDKIVAASDVCFLCQGVKFYPAKKYYKDIKKYNDALTKEAEKQLESIKKIVEETEIPVFNNSINYIEFGKRLAKDTLVITNDSIFVDLINSFKSLNALKNNMQSAITLEIDSIVRITGGGKRVYFYTVRSTMQNEDYAYIECSSYNHGSIWITDFESTEKGLDIINAAMVGDTKVEIYKAFKSAFKDFFYNSVIKFKTTNDNEYLIIGFDERSFVDYIKYHHYH